MNELVSITNKLSLCDRKNVAKQVMEVCRAITPQFYKSMTLEEMKAERLSIELLTNDIDTNTLSEMCKRAVLNYPRCRSENPKAYFDINYILQFYKQSFNYIHYDSVVLNKNAVYIGSHYDDVKKILWEKWKDGEQEIIIGFIKEYADDYRDHKYSPKFHEHLISNLSDVEF